MRESGLTRYTWKKGGKHPLPAGMTRGPAPRVSLTQDEGKRARLLHQAAMSTAKAPLQSLLMNAFMLWMVGNSLQIFSIMMLGMTLLNPIKAMIGLSGTFSKYEHPKVNLALPKLIFIALNLALFGMALWKCEKLGLLPSGTSLTDTHVIHAQELVFTRWVK